MPKKEVQRRKIRKMMAGYYNAIPYLVGAPKEQMEKEFRDLVIKYPYTTWSI